MSHQNPEAYTAICDAIVQWGSITDACARNRYRPIGVTTFFRWMAECRINPEKYTFQYGEFGEMTFIEAVNLAFRMNVAVLESHVHKSALHGYDVPVIYQGEVRYKPDPAWIGVSDKDMMALGFNPKRDRILFDKHGRPVPETEHREGSDMLKISVLKAKGGKAWQDRKEIEMTHYKGSGVQLKTVTVPKVTAPVIAQEIEDHSEPEPVIEDAQSRAPVRMAPNISSASIPTTSDIDDDLPEYVTPALPSDTPLEKLSPPPIASEPVKKLSGVERLRAQWAEKQARMAKGEKSVPSGPVNTGVP